MILKELLFVGFRLWVLFVGIVCGAA
jgi:hypothetical protein